MPSHSGSDTIGFEALLQVQVILPDKEGPVGVTGDATVGDVAYRI
jgi:hypothetical protein